MGPSVAVRRACVTWTVTEEYIISSKMAGNKAVNKTKINRSHFLDIVWRNERSADDGNEVAQ